MKRIRHTLVSDGTSDANLIPIIDWTLKEVSGVSLTQGVRAEFWRFPRKPEGLPEKIIQAIEHYPCDVLFVHRDAEKQSSKDRVEEIQNALAAAKEHGVCVPAVAVVPVRMLEAWLCFDEAAIRKAAGNPNGNQPLSLPDHKRVEARPCPKNDLKKALLAASGLQGRRLKKFNTAAAFWRIVDYIEDFSPLRQLPAYRAFEAAVERMQNSGWSPGFHG
jgi:Domain of unknown function (DUF4276)